MANSVPRFTHDVLISDYNAYFVALNKDRLLR